MDSLNTQPSSQIYARTEAMKYLKQMPPGTEISIFQLSNLGLRTVQGFTSDPTLLNAAMNSIVSVPLDAPPASLPDFCAEEDGRNRTRIEVLNRMASLLSGIKGRKNIIWFMEGIATLENTGLRERINMAAKQICIPDYAMDLRKTYGLLTANQVAVYPVDARGLFTNPASNAQAGGNRGTAGAISQFEQSLRDQHNSMEMIAEATGGEARYDDNNIAGTVRQAIEKGGNYYSVSYVPPDLNFDGKYHKIEVKVNRPGVHLEYRKGYNADDIAQLAKTTERSVPVAAPVANQSHLGPLMGRGVPTVTDLLFDVQVEPDAKPAEPPPLGALDPKFAHKALTRYDFHFALAASQITFADAPDGSHKSSLIVDIAAYDGQGKIVTSVSQTTSWPLTADAYKRLPEVALRCVQQLDLPPGAIFVRVGMLDTATNKAGTLEIPLNIGKLAVAKK
jgi:VWFA-related protein